jgi:hypothetical protein
MKRTLILLATVLVVAAAVLQAKGDTIKVVVTGPGLAQPLELTDKEVVAANVWAGNFVDWTRGKAVAPAANTSRYLLQFHVQPPRMDPRMMYVVRCVWDDSTDSALVYLPGRGDQWYHLNVSTILRDGRDGHWFYATDQWSRAMRRALPQ